MITDTLDLISTQPTYATAPVKSLTSALTNDEQKIWNRVLESRITDQTKVKPLKTAITVAGATFARFGDFSLVMGQRKAGKTTILQYMAATALMDELPPGTDSMQIRAAPANGRLVVYVDTEGSHEDTRDFLNGVMRIMGADEMPKNFMVFHWRVQTQKECRESLEILFKVYPNIHLCILDGAADILSRPNDEGESNETVRFIMKCAGDTNACIVCVIHDNPVKAGQETKARGHFGSELERKASGAISVEKNREEKRHYIKCRFLRKSDDFEPIMFWYENNRPTSRMLTIEERTSLLNKDYQKVKTLTVLRDRCFFGVDSRSDKDLKISVKLYQGESPTKEGERKKCDRNIAFLLEHNLIEVEDSDSGPVYRPVRELGLSTAI